MLSRTCEYAIQAVLYLAKKYDTPYVSVKAIAEQNNISFHFLGKILQTLTQQGLVISYRGPNGGVSLSRPPEEITVLQVVETIDGLEWLHGCIIGLPTCDETAPCALHQQWKHAREEIRTMLAGQNIAQLLATSKAPH
jgi:Rrf2 family transcriptional regulator, iron-sulfur cluster assembly transcription factor